MRLIGLGILVFIISYSCTDKSSTEQGNLAVDQSEQLDGDYSEPASDDFMLQDQDYSDSEEVVLIEEVDDDSMTETIVISTKNFSDTTKEKVIAMTEEAASIPDPCKLRYRQRTFYRMCAGFRKSIPICRRCGKASSGNYSDRSYRRCPVRHIL